MSMPKNFAVVALLLMAAACEATYYKVPTPPQGGSTTRTTTRQGRGVEFKDAKTGAKTTLQNPQVLDIDEQMFEAGVAATAR